MRNQIFDVQITNNLHTIFHKLISQYEKYTHRLQFVDFLLTLTTSFLDWFTNHILVIILI